MNPIVIDPLLPITSLRKMITESGIKEISEVSDHLEQHQKSQAANGIYPYDRYLVEGSNNRSEVVCSTALHHSHCSVWCVNHYLGLNRNPALKEAAKSAIDRYGTGSGTSAVSGGNCQIHIDLCQRLASFLNKESCILFTTGYTANLGFISSIATQGDLILIDRDSHASIVDGCRMSKARYLPFQHNDVKDLESKLKRFQHRYDNVFVIVEGAYSMSGTIAPLQEIVALKDRYGFMLYVDEAHTFGLYGHQGRGICDQLGVLDEVDFVMSTLSKAAASVGGFIATKSRYVKLVSSHSNQYMFQATMPPADAAVSLKAIDLIAQSDELRERLHTNNQCFRRLLVKAGFNFGESRSPVVPVYIPDSRLLTKVSQGLWGQGVFSVSVIYPAVRKSEGRIRFIVSATHTREDIYHCVQVLANVYQANRNQIVVDEKSTQLAS